MNLKTTLTILLIALFSISGFVTAAEITINPDQQYQTIEGLGAAIASHMLNLHNNPTLLSRLTNDLGMSMLRIYPSPSLEPVNDNNDPSVFDNSKIDIIGMAEDGPTVLYQLEIIKKLKIVGMPRIILSVFSPGGWMKTGGSEIGGSLREDMYDEFAEFYSKYITTIKDQTGVDVYAISPQNEPRWEQWYSSCVYTYPQMRDIIKVLGARFENDGIAVKIFAAEDLMGEDWIQWRQPWVDYYDAIMADPEAKKYCDIIAVHTYEDGVQPSSPSAKVWQEVYEAASFVSKPVWMSETSGYGDTFQDGFSLASAVYSALHYGNCSAWVWLNAAMRRSFNPQEGLIIVEDNGRFSYPPKYYCVRQYFRFIRPGAIRIAAVSDDNDVLCLAFDNPQDDTFTMVLINQGITSKEVKMNGMDFPKFEAIRTSETENCVQLESVTDSLTLPAKSITTLFSDMEKSSGKTKLFNLKQNYPNPFKKTTTVQYTLLKDSHVKIHVYNILGEKVKTLVSENQAADDYDIMWDGTDSRGKVQGSGIYFCKLQMDGNSTVRKMFYLK